MTQQSSDAARLKEAQRAAAAAPHHGSTQPVIPPKTHGPQGTTRDPNGITTDAVRKPSED